MENQKVVLKDLNQLSSVSDKFKSKFTEKQIIEEIVNRQLEPFDKKMDSVLERKEEWYWDVDTTQEEKNRWMEWAVNHIVKNSKDSFYKKRKNAEIEMSWIDLKFGLRIRKEHQNKYQKSNS